MFDTTPVINRAAGERAVSASRSAARAPVRGRSSCARSTTRAGVTVVDVLVLVRHDRFVGDHLLGPMRWQPAMSACSSRPGSARIAITWRPQVFQRGGREREAGAVCAVDDHAPPVEAGLGGSHHVIEVARSRRTASELVPGRDALLIPVRDLRLDLVLEAIRVAETPRNPRT